MSRRKFKAKKPSMSFHRRVDRLLEVARNKASAINFIRESSDHTDGILVVAYNRKRIDETKFARFNMNFCDVMDACNIAKDTAMRAWVLQQFGTEIEEGI